MKYFIDGVEVDLKELERVRKEECTRNLTCLEELIVEKIDIDKGEIYFTFWSQQYED